MPSIHLNHEDDRFRYELHDGEHLFSPSKSIPSGLDSPDQYMNFVRGTLSEGTAELLFGSNDLTPSNANAVDNYSVNMVRMIFGKFIENNPNLGLPQFEDTLVGTYWMDLALVDRKETELYRKVHHSWLAVDGVKVCLRSLRESNNLEYRPDKTMPTGLSPQCVLFDGEQYNINSRKLQQIALK